MLINGIEYSQEQVDKMEREMRELKGKPKLSEYKGKTLLEIPLIGGKPFKFGIKKASAMIEYIEVIKKFIASGGKSI